ncbi:MAG TPA: translation elongation factor 4 [Candidatus Paceibacterota bacterium]|jgi:GTP-binding protein LepA|nr:translation elongation factor 4 [Candidatus Paceibacterota bacterium]HJN62683.1 translation elongation factor 4 [Candidatus Paceibacterota bacterium]|tara:strand:+ start:9856 stop:11658 length:1803 start_codon:yes stop_codon:yes gene_type:complete
MIDTNLIRNFSIIAHIDHGKSTLADRMLEETKTIEKRKMKEQLLDTMDLERERGITIKMQPVRMLFESVDGNPYTFNLIDTPGHIDFSYEVSRALKAVEGSILLVDSTQGIQAQTLTTLRMAEAIGLKIVPVLSKIDSSLARVDEVESEICELLGCKETEIIRVSGKTGEGVKELMEEIVSKIPSPNHNSKTDSDFRSLTFDFKYSTHKGVVIYTRVFDGEVKRGNSLLMKAGNKKFSALEVGKFAPEETPVDSLGPGEIGYIVTGIKEPGVAFVGDTISALKSSLEPLEGFLEPKPVVWASVYPNSQDDFDLLRQALERLRLSDSSFSFEEESSGSLGRGFRSGFLGMLHLEIITERIRREFNLEIIVTTPSITYEVLNKSKEKFLVYSPVFFPEYGDIEEIKEPWINLNIITPGKYLGNVMQLLFDHEAEVGDTTSFKDGRAQISSEMPLRELMRNFFDELKNVSSGYASLSYETGEMRKADVVKLDLLVADEVIPAFSRIVSKKRVQEEAEKVVEKLHEVLPRQMFVAKIQGRALGRILSSKTLKALRKDVTQHMYGGDITRKMKLREKQKKGKKKMKEGAKVSIPQSVFMKMMRSG